MKIDHRDETPAGAKKRSGGDLMADTIIKSLWDYFLNCPLMGNKKINIDFLPEKGVEYSIDTTPATEGGQMVYGRKQCTAISFLLCAPLRVTARCSSKPGKQRLL